MGQGLAVIVVSGAGRRILLPTDNLLGDSLRWLRLLGEALLPRCEANVVALLTHLLLLVAACTIVGTRPDLIAHLLLLRLINETLDG